MTKIQWEYDLCERPFCEQLQAMGWSWLEGDVDVPELTERESFRETLFVNRVRVPESIMDRFILNFQGGKSA